MNIGIAVHNYDASEGTGGYVVQLLPRLAAVHRITLYAAGIRAPVPEGVTVVRVPAVMTRAYTAILTFPIGLRRVRRRHDLLHAQGWVAPTAEVVTAHIVMAGWREASRLAGVQPPPGERLMGGFVQRREAELLGRARHVIAPSEKVRREIGRYYARTADMTVIPHGFPSAAPTLSRRAAREQLCLPDDGPIALFVGDLRKGFEIVWDAVRAVPGTHLAVVSRADGRRWLARAAREGISHRVHWLGRLTDPAAAYVAADFLLHPTIYDSFGLVVAEAMAHGLAPIVTTSAGITELLTHGESAWLVDDDPQAGTLAAVIALSRDEALRRRLGEGARAVARRRDWDAVARETLAVYERVAAG